MQVAASTRAYPRWKADYPVEIVWNGGEVIARGRTRDISLSGLGLTISEVPDGASSAVHLRVDARPLHPVIELDGEIVWTTDREGEACDLGVRVEPFSSEQWPAWDQLLSRQLPRPQSLRREDLVPRGEPGVEGARSRRAWLSERLEVSLEHVGNFTFDTGEAARHVENLIGACQVPLGVAGPLLVNGVEARGSFYVPLATTEGTLVETYHHGMLAVSRAGGVNARVLDDRMDITPVFIVEDVSQAVRFERWLREHFEQIKAEAEQTTRHGRLVEVRCRILGRHVLATFVFTTDDAMGMNIANIAAERACEFIVQHYPVQQHYLRCNASADKKPASLGLHRCYGKEVVADATIPARVLRRYFGVKPEDVAELYYAGVLASVQAGMLGMNAHYANGLTAIYMACGQDVAQVVNSAVGITATELTSGGDLYMAVRLPSLIVATVGGGTHLATQGECLRIMDCFGHGKARKFAEIVAAALLAGELAIFSAVASGRFAGAHLRKRTLSDS